MKPFLRKLSWWAQHRRKEDELREELEFHLDEEAEERQTEGLTKDQAKWVARRDLGNVTLVEESTRATWTWTFFEQFMQDLRYAARAIEQPETSQNATWFRIPSSKNQNGRLNLA